MKKILHYSLLTLLAWTFATPNQSLAANEQTFDVLEQSYAQVRRFVLDNGMVCLVKEDHSAPVAAMQIWVGIGSIHEGEHMGAGLSHYVEHMIFKGTEKRSPADITKEINDAGGFINAYTTFDRTVFYTTLPSKNVGVAIDVLSDAVMHATFPEDQWRQEKNVVLREFAMGYDDPNRVLGKLARRTAFRVHPYRFPVIGYEEIFNKTDRDILHTFFKKNYISDNMITVVVGDFDGAQVETQLREAFAAFKLQARTPIAIPQEPKQLSPRFIRETAPYQVSRLAYTYHTVALDHPDAAALDVLAIIVGKGRSSRLVKHIQEELKLVHAIGASSYTPKHPGMFDVDATIDPTKEKEARAMIEQEINSWQQGDFTEQEIGKAKKILLVGELSDLQTMKGQAASIATGEFFAYDPAFAIHYLQLIEQVTAEDLRRVASIYLSKNNQTLAILSPEGTDVEAQNVAALGAQQDVEKRTLDNEATLLVREDHRIPFVYFCAAFNGGLLSETEENNGITQLVSDLLTRGTASRTSDEVAQFVDERGGSFHAFSGKNTYGILARCLKGDEALFAELLSEAIAQPAFSEDDIEKQRAIQIASIQQKFEEPRWVAAKNLKLTLFPGNPYRFDTDGSVESVSRLTRKELTEHHERLSVGKNMTLSIFGDITQDEAKTLAEQSFAKLQTGIPPSFKSTNHKPTLPALETAREPKQQAILYVGFPGVDVLDPRADALEVLQNTLSGLSSQLGIEVREKRGLVYYIGARSQTGPQPGMFYFVAGAREDTVEEVRTLIDAEIGRVTGDGIEQEEFDRAKEQILSAHHIALQDNMGLAQSCAINELVGLGYAHTFSTKERLENITLEDVRKAASTILDTNYMATSMVLPSSKKE